MNTGTIKSTVKLQVLENKWQQKKNENLVKKPDKEMTQEERLLADYKEWAKKEYESNAHADIYSKLKSGGKLTSEEISYLEQNDPEALRRYREDQTEKEAYERKLKNCKTKDEVERVKMNQLGNYTIQAKKISTDPYIPLDKKVELMNQLNDKLCRVNQAHMEFVSSPEYSDMPTESEVEKLEKESMSDSENISKEASEPESNSEINFESESASQSGFNSDLEELDFEKLKDSIHRFVVKAGNTLDLTL